MAGGMADSVTGWRIGWCGRQGVVETVTPRLCPGQQ